MLKYLIIGAGGTGGALAAYMGRAGMDVTLIARGAHLEAIQRDGLTLVSDYKPAEDQEEVIPVKAMSAEEYEASGNVPDVIFLCTKSYSVSSIAAFVNAIAGKSTIIIPILNGMRMGEYVRRYISGGIPVDGCIYTISMKDGDGRILMKSPMLRVVYGSEDKGALLEEVRDEIYRDLIDSGIRTVTSDNILRDTIRKYSFIGPAVAAGLLYDANYGVMQEDGEAREFFVSLVKEVEDLAHALGVEFDIDLVKVNLDIIDNSSADSDTSCQRDVKEGRANEFETLVVVPYELGQSLGVDMPCYRRAIEDFRTKHPAITY